MSRVRCRSRWFAGGFLAAGCSLLNSGCTSSVAERNDAVLPIVRLVKLPPTNSASGEPEKINLGLVPVLPTKNAPIADDKITPVAYRPELPEKLPNLPTPKAEPITHLPPPSTAPAEKIVPINLDTVFRLAEEQNAQVALVRARLNESESEQRLAAKAWLPKVYAGTSYYRHEGGIQNEDGTLIHSSTGALFSGVDLTSEFDVREFTFQQVSAERKSWQQRGEVSKVTSETMLEAATTYLDLLTARRGEAVARELEKYLLDIQDRTTKMVTPSDRSAQVLVESTRAEVSGRRQNIVKLHQQGDAAAAKLAYLLGLGSCARMIPVEAALTPIDLVDPTPPLCDLVTQAVTNGPGVRELQSMLTVMQNGLDRVTGPMRYLPIVEMRVGEWLYGAGPGGEMSFDNRLDMGLRVRWNLTEFVTAHEKQHLAETRIEQARLSYDDLRGKLTAGVQEARDASLSGREEIRHAAEQIKYAAESYHLSDERLKNRAPNSSVMEVLQAIRGLEAADYNYLTAINAYNKAQIRLLVLLGPTAAQHSDCGAKK